MTDEPRFEQRVSRLESRMDVLEAVVPLRLASIESQTKDNGEKLDDLLALKDRDDGREQARKEAQSVIEARRARDENRRIVFWSTAVLVLGGLIGCLIEAHWQILP